MVKILKTKKMLIIKIEIDLIKHSRLFKVSFVLKDFLRYRKLISIIYSRTLDNYSKYYIKNYQVTKIT